MKAGLWFALASGPAAIALWWLAGWAPGAVEAVYSRGLYPWLMGPWSQLTGAIPVALAPLLLTGLVVLAVVQFWLVPPLKALTFLGAGVSVLVAWFVLGWGMNYQRLSWAEAHGRTAAGGSVAELEQLAGRLAVQASLLRSQVAEQVDWPGAGVRQAVAQAWNRAGSQDPLLAGAYGTPKAFFWPEGLSWLGIAGIFIPHTGEALVNPGPGDWQIPFTTAHEAAHLRGWAREDEANFLAFWVLRDDPNPALAYSAWSSALLYVASALNGAEPEGRQAWARVVPAVDSRVLADWGRSTAYWDRFRGPARQVAQAVNDAYLKSQGQSDGIKSYGRMVDLLLAWESDAAPR